jgi:hypothetical protein
MAFIIVLYVLADVVRHKGLTRVLFPKTFTAYKISTDLPQNKSILLNQNKTWEISINTKKLLMDKVNMNSSGFECDIYFDTLKHIFDVHHDADNSTGWHLDSILALYRQRSLKASIWLDFKNLTDSNADAALTALIRLRNQYGLNDKLLVESHNGHQLTAFSDSGFYTSLYMPLFNPYQITDEETKNWVDSISAVIAKEKISALSGYYFQYPFLNHFFPNYPILTWAANNRYSIVNRLFKRKVARDKNVFIVLYP